MSIINFSVTPSNSLNDSRGVVPSVPGY